MKKNMNMLLTLVCLFIFMMISILYFYPILYSYEIIQPDIINYIGGSKELTDYQKVFNNQTYWSNSMFSGMPTYQLGVQYPLDLLKYIDKFLRFLPRPADYIFLLLSGFFFLGIIYIKSLKYSFLGATMFGLSSYFFIILEAGHNSKIHSIAYFAPLLSGIYLLFEKKKFLGFLLTTLFFGLELMANHIQMTYYFCFIITFFILSQFYIAIKNNQIKSFGVSFFGLLIAGILACGMNATRLLSTYEYEKESTRGKSELIQTTNKSLDGLTKEYITTWSYGKLETFNLFIPNFMGGSSSGKEFDARELKKVVYSYFPSEQQDIIISQLSNGYWGEQPGTSPAYQGAVVCFLAFLSFFFIPKKYLLWIIPSLVISILLAWGKNFMILTDLFINYFPLYNKFRSVSSFMVIPEFLTPFLAMIGLYYYLNNFDNFLRKKILYRVGLFTLGILFIFYFFGKFLFNFTNSYESKLQIPQILLDALKKDRIRIFQFDVFRTFLFCTITLILLSCELHKKISHKFIICSITLLSILDLWGINKRFLNNENFISSSYIKNLFPTKINDDIIDDAEHNEKIKSIFSLAKMNKVLSQIREKDTSTYRVFNTCLNPFNESNTSYFHQSIGGYHAAKLKKYQELIDQFFDFQIGKFNIEILNMLNVKYIIAGSLFDPKVIFNPYYNGNSWFISKIKFVKNANQELNTLKEIKTKKVVTMQNLFKSKLINKNGNYKQDNTAIILLKKYYPNFLIYESKSKTKQFAVFSEIFYPHGWYAFLDGKLVNLFRVNYVLRGLEIPEGIHKIEFKFEPKIIKKGKIITLISIGIFILLSFYPIISKFKKN